MFSKCLPRIKAIYADCALCELYGKSINAQNNKPCFKIFPTDQHDLRRQDQSTLFAKSAGNPLTHKIICHVSKYFPQINMIYADNIHLRSLRNLRESINAQNNKPCFKIFPTDQHDLRRQYQSALSAKSSEIH